MDYIHSELYGVHSGQSVLDPKIQMLLEVFGQKVSYSKLQAGAKADVASSSAVAPVKSAKQQRKDRIAREAAAKAKKAALLAAPDQ